MNRRSTTRDTTKKLHKETKSMEEKLKALRQQMDHERHQFERSRPQGNGGSRWESSSRTRGSSLRGFAKETKNSKFRPRKAIDRSNVQRWTVDQVLEWLTELGMRVYHGRFRDNEIDGNVLLEIEADDLNFLEITVLGHRKKLIREISTMRQICGLRPNASNVARQNECLDSPQKQQVREKTVLANSGEYLGAAEAQQSGSLFDGVYDERAEQEAFKKAVEEWRSGGSSTSASTKLKAASGTQTKENSAAQNRPSTGTVLDESEEHEKFKRAVESWRHTKATEGPEEEGVAIVGFDKFQDEVKVQRNKFRAQILHDFEEKLMEPSPRVHELEEKISHWNEEHKSMEADVVLQPKPPQPITDFGCAF